MHNVMHDNKHNMHIIRHIMLIIALLCTEIVENEENHRQ